MSVGPIIIGLALVASGAILLGSAIWAMFNTSTGGSWAGESDGAGHIAGIGVLILALGIAALIAGVLS